MAFKINDVRVGRKTDGTVTAYLHGLGQGSLFTSATSDPPRAGLMLAVFALGRDCYWDEVQGFQTTLVPWNTTPSPIPQGRVDHWEIQVPGTPGHQPQVYLSLISDAQVQKSSGSTAIGWATIQVPENLMPILLGLLTSRYCYYSANGLRNTQVLTDIGWTAP